MFRFGYKFLAVLLFLTAGTASLFAYYYPPDHFPPGSPPNYNPIDPAYFDGVPSLGNLGPEELDGYFVYFDSVETRWSIVRVITFGTALYEQFHGSILVQLEQEPQPGVNFWTQGFDLSSDLHRNDRWGWAKWPDSVAPNLYEIWWDFTVECPEPSVALTRTIGFWKTHSGMGPQDDLVTQYLPIWLGTPDGPKSLLVSDAQIAFDVLSMGLAVHPLDGISKLRAQLLATKLDIASGTDGSVVAEYIELADAFLAEHDPSDWSELDMATRQMVLYWKDMFDAYNNGYIGPGHADDGSIVVDCDEELGCPPCVVGVSFSGCAFDFNLWGSSYNEIFSAERIYLGAGRIPLSLADGYSDTFEGLNDPYGHPFDCPEIAFAKSSILVECLEPNLSVFTPVMLPGASYNVNGMILPGDNYGNTYGGARVYEGNGLQFSVDNCPENNPPVFEPPVGYLKPLTICLGEVIYDTIVVNDFDPGAYVTLTKISGPGDFVSTPGYPPVYGYFSWTPAAPGQYVVIFEAIDNWGAGVVDSIIYDIAANQLPVSTVTDTSVNICWEFGQICYTIPVTDAEGDILTFSLLSGNGSIDPETGELCFTPESDGEYFFEAEIFDACGSITVAFTITVTINHDPRINPYDTVIIACERDSICFDVTAYDPDPGDSLEINFVSGPGIFTQTGNGIGVHCFLPDDVDSARYVFVYNVTDNCWRETFKAATPPVPTDSIVIIVILDQPPVITCPEGIQEVFLCGADSVCLDIPVEPADAVVRILEPGAVYQDGRLCVYAQESGIYDFTLIAEGECGADTCTVTLDVMLDTAPMVYCPPSGAFHLCGPDSVSVPLAFAPATAELTITPEASYANGMLTFFAGEPGQYCFEVAAVNGCGEDVCNFCITISFDSPPTVTIADSIVFQCSLEVICVPYSFSDPDNNVVSVSVLGLKNYYDPSETEGEVCFVPEYIGYNEFIIKVTDACGHSDYDTATIVVIPNIEPIASLENTTFRLCEPGVVCLPLTMLDRDGVIDSVVAMPPAYYDPEAQTVCLPVQSTGLYQVTAFVYDNCGAMAKATAVARVIINYDPVLTVPNDTTVFQCDLSEICLSGFIVTDRNYNLADIEFTPDIGTYSDGSYCFTPQEPGEYCFVVRATDSCGAYDEDTVCVTFQLGDDAEITCPADILYKQLCGPDSIYIDIPVTPAEAEIFVVDEAAIYENGQLCFYAGESGLYEFTLIAIGDCGNDTCIVTVDVAIDDFPQITCPPSDTMHLCGPTMINLPLGYTPETADLTITPEADYSDGMIHFFVEEPGEYCFSATASNQCGTDSCSFCITVIFDEPPIVIVTDTTVFLCSLETVCVPITYSDPNDNIVGVVVEPAGFDMIEGEVCFLPDGPGVYEYYVLITDSCGLSAVDTGTVVIVLNEGPSVSVSDSAVFICEPGEVCLPVEISDPEGRLGEIFVSEPAYLNLEDGTVCLNVTESGDYQIIVTVYDDCGAMAIDTGNLSVELGQAPMLACPASQEIHLCWPDTIMLPLSVTPVGSAIRISPEAIYEYGLIKFLPGEPGEYCFEVIAENECGADTCTFCITVTYDSPPAVTATDSSIYLCVIEEICVPITVFDPDGNIVSVSVSPENFALVDSQVCFTPMEAGIYDYYLTVLDECGNTATATGTIEVTMNLGPMVSVGDDAFFLCEMDDICLPVEISDPDGVIDSVIVSPPWSYNPGLQTVCRSVSEAGEYNVLVTVYDDCGVSASDGGTATVIINTGPTVTLPNDTALFLCELQELCFPVEYSDPDGNLAAVSVSPEGYEIVDGHICFLAESSGAYEFIVTATDSCGVSDTDTLSVDIIVNEPPVVIVADTTLFSCEPLEVCVSASISDRDGSIDSIIVTQPAYYNEADGTICLPVEESGSYNITVTAYDDCGAFASDIGILNVSINSAPQVAAPADTGVFVCTPGEICLSGFEIYDLDGNIANIEFIPDLGVFIEGTYCFTPQEEGEYCFITRVTDECGAWAEDTVCVTYQLGLDVAIGCPEGIQPVSLCNPDSVCLNIPVEPAGADVIIVEPGAIYENGKLCFFAEGEGLYTYTLIATGDCGADTCQVTFDVDLMAGPQVTCPADTAIHLCDPDSISIPIGVIGAATQVTVSPEAAYGDGMVTFYAGSEGKYCFEVIASNECGSDTCSFCVTVTIDSPPWVSIADTSLFLCNLEEVCVPYEYGDPDDNVVSVTVVNKQFSITEGLVCFTPAAPGIEEIILKVADSCGHMSVDTAIVAIILNQNPSVFVGDTSVFLCQPAELCVPVITYDLDGTIDSIVAVEPAYFDAENNTVCLYAFESGNHKAIVKVYDDCGAVKVDTGIITVRYNYAPMVTAPADTSLMLCDPAEICLEGFSVIDIDNNLESIQFIPDIGTYSDGRYCFTPQEPGEYCIVMQATDTCGAIGVDTVCVNVTWGEYLTLSCPEGIQEASLCEPDTVCIDVPVMPVDVEVIVLEAGGFYRNGQLCFFADHSGRYTYTVIATGQCNTDTCIVITDVSVGELPVIACPEPEPAHRCGPDSISVPLTFTPPTAELIVTPEASYADGMLTFFAESEGEYCFEVIAVGECGNDTCNFCITVTFDGPPVVSVTDSVISLCALEEICIPVAYSDPDNNIRTIEVYPPEYDLVEGAVCFTPTQAGVYEIIVTVTDSCDNRTADTGRVEVLLNVGPSVQVSDSAIFLCEIEDICLPVTMSDPDGYIDSIEVSAPAYYDAENQRVCRSISAAGTYQIIVKVYDDCGVVAIDTGTAVVTINTGPTVDFGEYPGTLELCDLSQICLPIVVFDADDNIVNISGSATCGGEITFGGNNETICWLPNTFGNCIITVIVTDACGRSDTAQAQVELIELPQPYAPCPGNVTIHACEPGEQICVDLGEIRPTSHITIRPSYYSYVPDLKQLCYFADHDRTDTVTVIDSTACGKDSCKFVLKTIMNRPPVISGQAPQEVEFCHSVNLCVNYTVSDPDNNIKSILLGGTCPGAVLDIVNSRVCLEITTELNCAVSLIVIDFCEAADTLILPIIAIPNRPPQIHLPEIETVVRCIEDDSPIVIPEFCVTDADYDEVILIKDSGLGEFAFDAVRDCGVLTFTPPNNDSAQYCFRFLATDQCDTVYERFCLNVLPALICSTCVDVAIEDPGCVNSGQVAYINITVDAINDIGAFDLLVGYDATALSFLRADIGSAIDGWEYFTYRYGDIANCGAPCPSGLIRLVSIADINNGAAHPPAEQLHPSGRIATMTFRVSNDINFGGQNIPIQFIWTDCGDNAFSDPTGQYLYVDNIIYTPGGSIIWDESNDAVYPESARPPHVGAPDECMIGDKFQPVRCVSLHNGALCITHPDSIDARGDMNLNGVAYEIADAVVYTNYFISGLSAFNINVAGQIAASDINADGLTLSIADLVYLIRVIIGDAQPYPKVIVGDNAVYGTCTLAGQEVTVSVNSAHDIGAALLVFNCEGALPADPVLADGIENMDIKFGYINGHLRVLIYSFEAGAKIRAGVSDLVRISVPEGGTVELAEMELADYYGRDLNAKINNKVLPQMMELTQNRPNPFNPTTAFELALPAASDYIVTIYNITGQVVKRWSGYGEAGYVTFEWNGCDENGQAVASGIYFYRAQAAGNEAIRKMVLLK